MSTTPILIISPDPAVAAFLGAHLPAGEFAIEAVRPGADATARACREPLAVAIVDRIEQRADAAQLEISLLKQTQPQVRVIAISRDSSHRDARIVEQGLFYYWTGRPRPALVDLVQAAAGRAVNGKEVPP